MVPQFILASFVITSLRKEQGHRVFFKEVLEILKCHQDVLHGNWYGLLLKYAATYAPKFSDSFARERLNDEASAFSVARRILFDYTQGNQRCGSTSLRSSSRLVVTVVFCIPSVALGLAWT